MKEARRFDLLRSKHRRERAALMVIAGLNRRLTQAGKQLTDKQRMAEYLAAAAVKLARAELQAAIRWAGRPEGIKAVGWRYKAAFDAYYAIVSAHARRTLINDPISSDEIEREQEALNALAVARRYLLDAFAGAREQFAADPGPDVQPDADIGFDRIVSGSEAGLGGSLHQAEEAQLGDTDERPLEVNTRF
jgi:hypothetical protein